MGGACDIYREEKRCLQGDDGATRRKRTLGRHRHRRDGSIIQHIMEIGWDGVDRIHLAQCKDKWRALVNTEMNTTGFIKCGKFLGLLKHY